MYLDVPVQAISPPSRQKLRYLLHIHATSSRQTLIFSCVSLAGKKKMRKYTYNDKVGFLR